VLQLLGQQLISEHEVSTTQMTNGEAERLIQ
jgi:hypothetical protein